MSEDRKGETMTDTVWIVGRWPTDKPWEFQGVFLTREEAIAACRDKSYFIASAVLGREIQHATRLWPSLVYPLIEDSHV